MYGHHFKQSMDQPSIVIANPVRDRLLNRENNFFSVAIRA